MIKAVIVEDQKKALILLKNQLTEYCTDVEVVGTASSVLEGIKVINEHLPDLVFLDVELANGNGFDVLEALPRRDFQTIFVTAHNQYAVEAFRFQAVDYLLKPIDSDHLVEAVERSKGQMERGEKIAYKELIEQYNGGTINKLAVPTRHGLAYVRLEDILYIKADGNYSELYLQHEKKPMVVSRNLKAFEDMLKTKGFVRPHHSHLINVLHVTEYSRLDGGKVTIDGKTDLEVSKRNRSLLMQALSQNSKTI